MLAMLKPLAGVVIFCLALALGVDLGADIALADVSAMTPRLWILLLRLFDSGICYFLFPVIGLAGFFWAVARGAVRS